MAGLVIAAAFAVMAWLVLRAINCKYISAVDIMKIFKTSDQNEEARNGNLFLSIFGFLMYFTIC